MTPKNRFPWWPHAVLVGAVVCLTNPLGAAGTLVPDQLLTADVLVVGGTPGGVGAAIAAARMGVDVILTEETPWLGGPMTAAGVSVMDGLPRIDLRNAGLETEKGSATGIYGEFVRKVRAYYAQHGLPPDTLETQISVLAFEPHVGASILEQMATEAKVRVLHSLRFVSTLHANGRVSGAVFEQSGKWLEIRAKQVVDATEQGEVAFNAGGSLIEDVPLFEGRPMEQAITYVMILKNYGRPQRLVKPEGYDEAAFQWIKDVGWAGGIDPTLKIPYSFYDYGKLPATDGREKLMVNWGNDLPASVVSYSRGSREDRARIEEEAKKLSLCFLYWIQTVWSKDTWGLADDEFPTQDRMPFHPYVRDFRRVQGQYILTREDIYAGAQSLRPSFRADGIAIGDYAMDLHLPLAQREALAAADILPRAKGGATRVLPFQIPYGCLVPVNLTGLVMGDAAISKSYVANGATRLQPVRMGIGQAAGVAAALTAASGRDPHDLPYQEVQQALLRQGLSLYYYGDLGPDHPLFATVEEITLKGFMVERGHSLEARRLDAFFFRPDEKLGRYEAIAIEHRFRELRGPQIDPRKWEGVTRAQAATKIADTLEQTFGQDWFLKL